MRCSRNEIILVRYPFSDLTSAKVRPAIVVGQGHTPSDLLIVPLTSNTTNLASDEFVLAGVEPIRAERPQRRETQPVHRPFKLGGQIDWKSYRAGRAEFGQVPSRVA